MVQTSVFDQIENDGEFWDCSGRADNDAKTCFAEFLKTFLSKEKSESVQQNLSFPEQIKKLTDGLDLISLELKQKIRHDYPTLIKHSSNASK